MTTATTELDVRPTRVRSTILDTNTFRGLSDARFNELLELERKAGVYQIADAWTVMELCARLADIEAADHRAYKAALGRLSRRTLSVNGTVVFLAEVQAYRILFAEQPADAQDELQALANTALWAANADIAAEPALRSRLNVLAAHVASREQWFGEHFSELGLELAAHVRAAGGSVHDLRALVTSDGALRADAEAQIRRAYERRGTSVPEPVPPKLIDDFVAVFRPGLVATSYAFERVFCDGVSLAKSEHRNLIWDQEIAQSLGQVLGEYPTLIVTEDRYFPVAAARAGVSEAVLRPDAYIELLRAATGAV